MAKVRRDKRRCTPGQYLALPHAVLESDSFTGLGGSAVKLLVDLGHQFNGRNNGDLTVAYGYLRRRGWRSKSTIADAVKSLVEAELIIKTREGRFQNPGSCCDLYALTWHAIDECPGKNLDMQPTTVPPRNFGLERFKNPSPETGLSSNQKSGRERQRDERGRYVSYQKSGRSLECA